MRGGLVCIKHSVYKIRVAFREHGRHQPVAIPRHTGMQNGGGPREFQTHMLRCAGTKSWTGVELSYPPRKQPNIWKTPSTRIAVVIFPMGVNDRPLVSTGCLIRSHNHPREHSKLPFLLANLMSNMEIPISRGNMLHLWLSSKPIFTRTALIIGSKSCQ